MSGTLYHPTFDAALALHRAGACVMPLRYGDKTPAGAWAHIAAHPQAFNDAVRLFKPWAFDGANVALVGGQRSTSARVYLAVLDIDNPDALDTLAAAAQKACNAPPAMTRTGRGFQIVLRTHEPIATTRHAAGELRGRGSYSVMPPSLHPNGRHYEWLRHPERIPILRNARPLRDAGVDVRPANARVDMAFEVGTPAKDPGDFDKLPRTAREIIAGNAKVTGDYPSRSEVDFALFVTLANHGCDADAIAAWALRSQHAPHWRSHKDGLKSLYRDIARALHFARQQCTPTWALAQEVARDARAFAWQHVWRNSNGSQAESLRAALIAHADTVSTSGRIAYHLSVRDGATRAQMSARTFRKATNALLLLKNERITIQRTQSAQRQQASAARYSMTSNADTKASDMTNVREWVPVRLPNSDAFEYAALGRSARAVYAVLLQHGALHWRELVERTGRARATVFRALASLAAHGLAECDGAAWRGVERDADYLRGVAKAYGVDGRGARRAAEHKRQQAAYRRTLKGAKV